MIDDSQHIQLGDLLLFGEDVLGVQAEELVHSTNIPLAESALAAPYASFGGHDFYPDPIDRAAVLCSRIVKNHPLPDGNKRAGFIAMRAQLDVNGFAWSDPDGGKAEIAQVIEGLAAREMSEAEFIEWVRGRVNR